MNHKKSFILCFCLIMLFLISFSANGHAIDYDFGVDKGDKLIWRCTICDRDKMDILLGKGWDDNGTGLFEDLGKNRRMRWSIEDTDDNVELYNPDNEDIEEFLAISYKKWIWTTDNDWGDEDYITISKHYSNPKDYSDDYIFPQFAPIWMPLPFGDYLKDIELYKGYSIDARAIFAITCEIEKGDLKGNYPTEYIKIQAMYNDNGILTSYKLYLENHQVIVEIILKEKILLIPDFIVPFIPIIIAILYIGLIYFLYKKVLVS